MRKEELYIGTKKELEKEFKWIDTIDNWLDNIPQGLENIEKYLKDHPDLKIGKSIKSLKEQLDIIENQPNKYGIITWLDGALSFNENTPKINFTLMTKHIRIDN